MLTHLLLASSLPTVEAAPTCNVTDYTNGPVDWQSGSCYRGTWAILSSCLATIIACTWSIQHLNVPHITDGPRTQFGRRLKWMLITVLFPEIILVHAGFQFRMAWKALQAIEGRRGHNIRWPWYKIWWQTDWWRWLRDNWPWYTVWWKWLRGKFGKRLDDEERSEATQKDPDWTLIHCYYANMGGFLCDTDNGRVRLTAMDLPRLDGNPKTIKKDIKDKSEQDLLAKIWAGLQILQLIFSIITRSIQHMPFSQLEMVTLSFAVCGIMIYIINFHKPQGIDRALYISLRNPRLPVTRQTHDSLWEFLTDRRKDVPHKIESKSDPPRIPNDSLPLDNSTNIVHPVVYPLAGVSAIFGLINTIAWPFEFPTPEEKLLWRTATIVSAVCPIFALLSIPIAQSSVAAGKPELFLMQSLRLLQEYRWHYPGNYPVNEAIYSLRRAFERIVRCEVVPFEYSEYSQIFAVDSLDAGLFLQDVENFLLLRGRYEDLYSTPMSKPGDDQVRDPGRRLELHDNEKDVSSKALNEPGNDQGPDHRRDRKKMELHDDEEFKRNFGRLVKALFRTERKRLRLEARTDMWPRKSRYQRIWNNLILYGTSVLYCIFRLVLLGVAFSSLRKMPGKVYVATDWTSYLPFFGGRG